MADTEKKPAPDWETIEQKYRANVLPLRVIAAEDGNVTEGAIRKRAKRDGWERDLRAKIAQRAEELVRKEEVRKAGTQPKSANQKAADQHTIEVNAQAILKVRMAHRQDISRGRALALKMLAELEAVTDRPDLVQALVDALANPEEEGEAAKLYRRRLQDLMNHVVELPTRVGSLKSLSETLRNLITLERQAWNLDADDEKDPGKTGRELTDLERASKLAAIIDKARRAKDAAQQAGQSQ